MSSLGCCMRGNKYSSDESMAEQSRRSKRIDQMLAKDKRMIRKQVKLLLLGAGESGKSTFLKQMKIIHGHSLIDDTNTVDEHKEVIYNNIIKGMKVLIDARNKLAIDWGSDAIVGHAVRVFNVDNKCRMTGHVFRQYVQSICELWSDSGIRSAFDRRIEFQLSDGVRYLFDSIQRIGAEDYTPTNQDILYSRKATKSITEYCVTINKIPFRFVDVGGQRSQRQKWFQCFEGVTSILFIVSSSEYDQVLLEDRLKNRLRESQNIFETIVNNRCFSDVSYILFLNKTDLLEEKLRLLHLMFKSHKLDVDSGQWSLIGPTEAVANRQELFANDSYCGEKPATVYPINVYFPEFCGDPTDMSAVQGFILQLFDCVRRDRHKQLYHHFTTAIDTENIKLVFNDVRNTILQNNIQQLMLQ